jgi:RNA polymerase sigma-70 factor (ECF subfamily)
LDRTTLEGVRRHDPTALAAFFEHYVNAVYDLAHRMLGERASAEDATQEVFLRVHRAAARLDPDRSPRPWLLRITRNVCRDVWRSATYRAGRRSVPVDSEPPAATMLAALPETPEEALLMRDRNDRVRRAVTALPESLREVVLLHDWAGLRHDEIANMVESTHAAVRKRYSRALARLAELLQGEFE